MSQYVESILNDALHKPVVEFVSRQGKRIRYGLMQSAFTLCGGQGDLPSEVSESVEWLHAGSLIIDDIQDQSSARRGVRSMHCEIGVPLAINAGNWMYFKALESLSSSNLPSPIRQDLLAAMISAGGTCHEGQAIDLKSRVDQIPCVHWHATVERISQLKTGVLVRLATTMGAIAAGAPRTLVAAIGQFGMQTGVALQMRNDLDELAALAKPADGRKAQSPVARRDDDLRNLRVIWPWAWAVDVRENSIANLAQVHDLLSVLSTAVSDKSGISDSDIQRVASELLRTTAARGDRAIEELIECEIRLLGEHVVEHESLDALRKLLAPILHAQAARRPISIPATA